MRGDGQKLHRRPGLRASWHLMAKPIGYGGQGKCSACARKHRVLTWGYMIGKPVLLRVLFFFAFPLILRAFAVGGYCFKCNRPVISIDHGLRVRRYCRAGG